MKMVQVLSIMAFFLLANQIFSQSWNVQFRNSFVVSDDSIGVIVSALQGTPIKRSSPYYSNVWNNEIVSLEAYDDQIVDNGAFEILFNDTEASDNKSKWLIYNPGSEGFQISQNQNTSFTATSTVFTSESPIVEAVMRRYYETEFKNYFSGSSQTGTIKVYGIDQSAPYTQKTVNKNDVTAKAEHSYDDSGIRYIFDQWNDGYPNREYTFNVRSSKTLTAEYQGIPIFNESIYDNNLRGLTLSSGAGNKVKLTWNEHPHTNVTKYYIYRKIKNPDGSFTTPVHLATKNRGTLTFTDIEYTYQAGSGDYGLYYDVQAYYSTEGTYSPANYVYVRGDQSGDLTKDNSENNTQDLIVTNYDIGNFPNPFNPTTRINYQLPEQGHVTIKVYDMLGKEVAELVNETKESGIYNVNFDAGNLSSGVYVYMINVDALNAESKGYVMSKKMLMLK
jgi:hypothetical protein